MISDRIGLSPLWVGWLVRATIFAAFVGGVVILTLPMFVYRVGWLWAALAVVALCAITSGATTWIQRPIRRRYLDALQGLDRRRGLAALAASGPVLSTRIATRPPTPLGRRGHGAHVRRPRQRP